MVFKIRFAFVVFVVALCYNMRFKTVLKISPRLYHYNYSIIVSFIVTIHRSIVLSWDVPVFRPSNSTAMYCTPRLVTVLTCAAINMGIALRDHSEAQAKDAMRRRVLRVVQVMDRGGEGGMACALV